MRENLIREKHSGGLAGHFNHDKTFEQLQHFLLLAQDEIRSAKVHEQLQGLSACQREKPEYRTLYFLSYPKQALGFHHHGFCVGSTQNTKGL